MSYMQIQYILIAVFCRHPENIIQLLPTRKCTEEKCKLHIVCVRDISWRRRRNLPFNPNMGLFSTASQGQTRRQSLQNLATPENYLKKQCWSFSRVRLFTAPWTVAHQAPLSMGFSWVAVPFSVHTGPLMSHAGSLVVCQLYSCGTRV